MTNEILKDERLTDEQLDDVAGGTFTEIMSDALGMALARNDIDGFQFKDFESLRREWAKVGVATVYYDDKNTPNEYYIDGKQISRSDALKHLLTKTGHTEYIKDFTE